MYENGVERQAVNYKKNHSKRKFKGNQKLKNSLARKFYIFGSEFKRIFESTQGELFGISEALNNSKKKNTGENPPYTHQTDTPPKKAAKGATFKLLTAGEKPKDT